MDDIIQCPMLPWDRKVLSSNRNVCIDMIDADMPNAVGEWDWYCISSVICMEDVLKHPDRPWHRGEASLAIEVYALISSMHICPMQ